MGKLQFDKKVFDKGYAIYYTIAQRFLIIGFLFIIAVLLLPANTFTIPDEMVTIVCIYLISSIAGFPIISIVKIGMKRLLLDSELKLDKNRIYYNRVKEKICPSIGGIEERYIYQIEKIISIKETHRYYCVTGEIHQEIVNNGRLLEKKVLTMIKIPNAYKGMERMIRDE